VKHGKFATETLEMLPEAFGEHTLSRTAVYEWHSCFKVGQVSFEDDEHSGCRSTSKTTENIEKIRELINEDRRLTIHELADTAGISHGVCQILTEHLNLHRIAPSLRQCAHPHVPENHRVRDQQHGYIPHPPYLPDFAPRDFALFPKLKM
jgi:hypothetical protein